MDRSAGEGQLCPRHRRAARRRRRSCPAPFSGRGGKAQRTFTKAHDSAAEEYGDGERAHRVAYSALKHTHEKIGDHWEPKNGKGPSDAKAAGGRSSRRKTAGGVDANASKKHLMDVARQLDVPGRSKMTKAELVKAIQKANDKQTREARS